MRGLILFAHGSREPRWVEPFERLAARVRVRAPALEVRLAFLELMRPDLQGATDELARLGVTSIGIVPVFLGQGGHVRSDLPALLDVLRKRHPDIEISSVPAVGDDEAVIEALAEYCLRAIAL